MVKESVNEMMVLEEMAELAISDAYPKVIQDEKIDAIGRPEVAITKIAKGSDLEFKIVTAVLPVMDLPDYKKLATKIKKEKPVAEVAVDEAEVEKTILELRKMRAHQAMPVHEHQDDDAVHPPARNASQREAGGELSEEELPAFDDEFALNQMDTVKLSAVFSSPLVVCT
jgi:trigger factor